MTLGYYDRAKFTGNIHWNDIKFKYMFGVELNDVLVNGKSLGICKNRECLITFDSGTSLMSFPPFASQMLTENQIPTSSVGQGCKSEQDFGQMTLVIGGQNYVLENHEWMFPAVDKYKNHLAQAQTHMRDAGPLGPQIIAQ